MKPVTSSGHPSETASGAVAGHELRTLGGLTLGAGGFAHPKALALLCYLAIAGPQPRKRLARLFWPDATDPLNRLSVTLSRIRAAAPGAVDADRQRVWSELGTDATRLLRLLDAGRREAAVTVYGGAFLEGVYLPGLSEELEEWIVVTRDDLAGRVQGALLQLATESAFGGSYASACEQAERALDVGGSSLLPTDDLDRLHTLLVAGDSPRAYALRPEVVAVGSAPVTSRAEARDRLQREAGTRASPNNLRARGTSFVGRERERLELARLMALPDRRLITLVGPGGIGKTRLALQAASDQLASSRFPDGVFLVELEDAIAVDEVVPRIVACLGLSLDPEREPLEQLTRALHDRGLLLVLDNLEHLPDAAPIVTRLLEDCPRITLLATARDRLQVEAEWIFPVHGMPSPDDDTGEEGTLAWGALALFETRAQRSNPAFRLGPEDARHAVEICRLTGGSPLAIELAAAHVSVMSLADIATGIRDDLDFLQATTRTTPDRHRSLRVVFEHSWHLLHEDDRACLRKLAVFRGGFTREAASTVADATLPVLTSLVAQALVVRVHGDRYERHPLLHQYTWEKLTERPTELDLCQRRHAAWALDLATAAQRRLNTTTGAHWLDRLDKEHANLRAALGWADERRETQTLLQLTTALADFWIRRGHHGEALHWFERVSAHADAIADKRQLARALQQHAFVVVLQGNTEAPTELLARSHSLLREWGDDVGAARAQSHMGIVAVYQNRYDDAAAHYLEALDAMRRTGCSDTIARLLNNLGDVARFRGDPATARGHYEESLALVRALGDHQMVANVLGSLAIVALEDDRVSEARACLRESVQLLRDLGITFSLPTAFGQVAALATGTRRPLDAARLWGAAESLRKRIGAPLEPFERPWYDATVRRAREQARGRTFDAAWADGWRLAERDAVALALGVTETTTPSTRHP